MQWVQGIGSDSGCRPAGTPDGHGHQRHPQSPACPGGSFCSVFFWSSYRIAWCAVAAFRRGSYLILPPPWPSLPEAWCAGSPSAAQNRRRRRKRGQPRIALCQRADRRRRRFWAARHHFQADGRCALAAEGFFPAWAESAWKPCNELVDGRGRCSSCWRLLSLYLPVRSWTRQPSRLNLGCHSEARSRAEDSA